MSKPEDHFRVVYISWKEKNRIVSMSHVSGPKAHSMMDMLNKYVQFGHFRVEDEWETCSGEVATA